MLIFPKPLHDYTMSLFFFYKHVGLILNFFKSQCTSTKRVSVIKTVVQLREEDLD